MMSWCNDAVQPFLQHKPGAAFRPLLVRLGELDVEVPEKAGDELGHFHPADVLADAEAGARSEGEEEAHWFASLVVGHERACGRTRAGQE